MTLPLSEPTLWWIAAGLAVAVELATGTFYLLMIGLGMAAAALAAHAGAGLPAQLVCAAAVGGGAVLGWHLRRRRDPARLPVGSDPSVNLDIGQRVHVAEWLADGTARVHYRGALWTARPQQAATGDAGPPAPGDFVILAVEGNELRLGR